MSRVHLTLQDAARVRVLPELSSLIESAHALEAVLPRSARPGATEWTRRTRLRLTALPLVRAELVEAHRLAPHVLPLTRSPSGARGSRPHVSERVWHAARTLGRVARVVIAPEQARVRALQASAADRLGALLARRGAAEALESWGHSCRWTDTGLEICDGQDRDLALEGEGLELLPSVFLTSGPRVEQWTDPESGRPRTALLFPVPGPHDSLDTLLQEPDRSQEALGRLLGRTRSAILGGVVEPVSTGELAEALHVSPTSVSEHTAVLRNTGLLTTIRDGNRVQHLITGLGRALLHHCGTEISERRPRNRGRAYLAEPA